METIDWQERTKLLIKEKNDILSQSNVLIVGLGGVGGMAAEMICRAGVGKLTIVDNDTIHPSNINRQILAFHSNVGQPKSQIAANRLLDINPKLNLKVFDKYVKDENIVELLKFDSFDYVVDAIDTIAPKVYLLYNAHKLGLPIVSSMGAGGKTDATAIKIDDISKSYNCPLARLIRKRLHRLGVYNGIKVVFSDQKPNEESLKFVNIENKKTTLGTISFMPNIFGVMIASVVINDLINK